MSDQERGHLPALGILADQHGNLLVVIAFLPECFDIPQHPLKGGFPPGDGSLFRPGIREEDKADVPFGILRVLLGKKLLAIAIDAVYRLPDLLQARFIPECRSGTQENPVVELDDGIAAAPVFGKGFVARGGRAQVAVDVIAQQAPVGTPPAVDRLLDVAHDQTLASLRHAVAVQGLEILPLQQ